MIRAILCDIEGTTTALAFVHETLFPLSRLDLPQFLKINWSDPELSPVIQKLKGETSLHRGKPVDSITVEDAVQLLIQWIDADRKETTLKTIQGKIWKNAFESGSVKGHVYPDVPCMWNEWKSQGQRIYIFSSGSVEAQKLIFKHSECGDLSHLIDGYFDTATGPKKEHDSYRKIAIALNLDPSEMLFLSDTDLELDAAAKASMQTIRLNRETAPCESTHTTVHSFTEIQP